MHVLLISISITWQKTCATVANFLEINMYDRTHMFLPLVLKCFDAIKGATHLPK